MHTVTNKNYNKEDVRFSVKHGDGIITHKERPLNPMTAPCIQL